MGWACASEKKRRERKTKSKSWHLNKQRLKNRQNTNPFLSRRIWRKVHSRNAGLLLTLIFSNISLNECDTITVPLYKPRFNKYSLNCGCATIRELLMLIQVNTKFLTINLIIIMYLFTYKPNDFFMTLNWGKVKSKQQKGYALQPSILGKQNFPLMYYNRKWA